MPEIKSGLLDMETRSRRVPPPRHPKREVETPPPPQQPEPEPELQALVASATPTQSPAAPAVARIRKPAKSALRGAMTYLDTDSDAFLKACQAAGEVSSSAVIRLALAELAERRTPEEVARILLLGEHPAHRSPGRRRK